MPDARILVISEVFPPRIGGSGRWLWELYRRLPADRIEIAAGSTATQSEFDESQSTSIRRVVPHFASWGVLNLGGFRSYLALLRAVKPITKRQATSVIHAARCLPEGLTALAARRLWGIPYRCYVHGEELPIYAASRELRWLARRVMRGAAGFIVNSRNTQALLEREWDIPPSQIEVLHPGVDVQRFIPTEPSDDVRRSLDWHGRRVIFTASRLQPRKGHDVLIRALPEIRRACPNVLYAIVGDGSELAPLKALVQQLDLADVVQFRGEVDEPELLACYQQCDLFVLPNRTIDGDFEGFGMVLLEAQACGKPVIAGDSGGTAEAMLPGRTGEIVDCRTASPLAAAALRFLNDADRCAAYGAAGRDWVATQFDWDVLARQAAELFGLPTADHQSSASLDRREPSLQRT